MDVDNVHLPIGTFNCLTCGTGLANTSVTFMEICEKSPHLLSKTGTNAAYLYLNLLGYQ